MPSFVTYLQTFILAGTTVTGISYLGNAVNPLVAGILSGIPISIPSMLLIKGTEKQKKFILAASIMVALLSVITFLCWFLYDKRNVSAWNSVIISMVIWSIGGGIYYYYMIKK